MTPVIIEVAINGLVSKTLNPSVPITPDEIAAESIRCLDAGAAIIHNHIEDIHMSGDAAAERYGSGWAPVLRKHPDAILCPTVTLAEEVVDKVSYMRPCKRKGARMGVLDTGSKNVSGTAVDGSPGSPRFVYFNSFDELELSFDEMRAVGLGPSISIFEPGFLRIALAYHRAKKLPPGALIKIYFGGEFDIHESSPLRTPAVSFGLPPTARAFEAYLEMLEGCTLPWSVAVVGGDAVTSGIVRMALQRGGHIRVGLEDYGGNDMPTNMDLLKAALQECKVVGRPPATCAQAAEILGLP